MQTEQITVKSYQYLMEITFDRIKNNKEWDETFKPYSVKFLDKMLQYFTEREEYEKCSVIYKLKEKKIKH
jgi:hypothetical protein